MAVSWICPQDAPRGSFFPQSVTRTLCGCDGLGFHRLKLVLGSVRGRHAELHRNRSLMKPARSSPFKSVSAAIKSGAGETLSAEAMKANHPFVPWTASVLGRFWDLVLREHAHVSKANDANSSGISQRTDEALTGCTQSARI